MRVLGGILLAIGILIAGASGLCSAVFLFSFIGEGEMFTEMIGLVLMFGGIPFVIGVGLVFAGRALLQRRDEE